MPLPVTLTESGWRSGQVPDLIGATFGEPQRAVRSRHDAIGAAAPRRGWELISSRVPQGCEVRRAFIALAQRSSSVV